MSNAGTNPEIHRSLGNDVLADLLDKPANGTKVNGLMPEHFLDDFQRALYTAWRTVADRDGFDAAADPLVIADEAGLDQNLVVGVHEQRRPGDVRNRILRIINHADLRRIAGDAHDLARAAESGDTAKVNELIGRVNGTPSSQDGSLGFLKGSDVRLERVTFLDDAGTIPNKSLTVVVGSAGLGKTTFTIGIAAAGTKGLLKGLDGPCDVLISSQEDDAGAVLMPRFLAAGGDPERVSIIKGLTIPDKVPDLARYAKQVNARFLLVDPIASHLGDKVDSHRTASVRRALEPLSVMASDLGLAVVVVAHPNKSSSQSGLDRISGAGFGDAARSVIVFGTDPNDPNGRKSSRRIIGHQKLNVGPEAPSREAEIETVEVETEDGIATVPRLRIIGPSDVRAEAILSSMSQEERTERDEAKDFLLEILADGPVKSKDIKDKHAPSAGHNWRTVRRAKDDLDLTVEKKQSSWFWSLPDGGSR